MFSNTSTMVSMDYSNPSQRPLHRMLPILGIVLAHLGLIYALNAGLLNNAVQILPKELMVSLVATNEPAPEQPKPKISMPKLMPYQAVFAPTPEVMVATSTAPSVQTTNIPPTQEHTQIAVETSAPVVPTTPALPKVVTGVEYIQAPQAEYPPLSRRMGEEGKVVLRVLVNEKGRAEKVEIQKSSGSNRLDEAARVAISRALFKPYVEDGKPLMMLATAVISFSLNS
ncbi:TonB family protein [Undibacterium sp. RTI2.1]|uniref:energy transducer TonB n=1 Tax=unclassified Undibacterium TaxID=2630295 RepID=UPI002B22B336|nr:MULTISPECIES: TonB family protein [unclassified Undibacterium]MEB0031975.1 TonB family protein [Undibacterium sp. RTI2.1]MEB0118184.1 TonB family protein [Undibacterium sp. RTI2.2]